ncbi:histidine phosphatase superfamily [Mrakia frigida]|uniref:histidine phosphatase family protein n=1 Tax=Mrakia frigida TaxID=29902 RepID=UPI003FCC045B
MGLLSQSSPFACSGRFSYPPVKPSPSVRVGGLLFSPLPRHLTFQSSASPLPSLLLSLPPNLHRPLLQLPFRPLSLSTSRSAYQPPTMPLETIYIARHGFRINWVTENWSTPTKMARDPPLAGYGIAQAEKLGAHLASPPDGEPKPELVFSSPFYRCIQTSAPLGKALGVEIRLEHGIMEWYSTVPIATPQLLHPRPSDPTTLSVHFPPGTLDLAYSSTYYPSRLGETLSDLLLRARLFLIAFLRRIEEEYPDVKTICLIGHAASVIALGRALTGDKDLEVTAGCCTVSTYKRKTQGDKPATVGDWDITKNGDASFLEKGVERNWSFRDVVLSPEGEVIQDQGVPGTGVEQNLPLGIAPGFEKYLPASDLPQLSSSL